MDSLSDADQHPVHVDWEEWGRILKQFADATGLYVAAFDHDGRRRAGPYHSSRVAQTLADAGLWLEPDGAGLALEGALVSSVLRSGEFEQTRVCDELAVYGAPLSLGSLGVRGVIVYGWVFNAFSSALSCQRIEHQLGLPRSRLWGQARLESPVPSGRMTVYTNLLLTLISSAVRHLENVARLEELGRLREVFLAGVSHELRTPLSVLATRIEVLLRGGLDDPQAIRSALLKMKQHVHTEARLVEDLIDASRTRTGQLSVHKELTSLGAVLQAAIAAVLPHADAKEISVCAPSIDGGLDMALVGDPHRLQQVFWNVLSNAVKFTPPSGRVDVRLIDQSAVYEVVIEDTGRGIDRALLPHVFEPFTKQHQGNVQGLGLGLSIARHIVELHGGAIWVESAGINQGATFHVLLPKRGGTHPATA